MQNMSDNDRFSTQLEGKKLKGFGAKMGEFFGHLISSTTGVSTGIELDDERGIQAEEILLGDIDKEIEERKKKQAMLAAQNMQKQQQLRSTTHKRGKGHKAEKEKSELTPENSDRKNDEKVAKEEVKKEIEEIRETGTVRNEALTSQQQVKAQDPVKEGQKIMETAQVRQEALMAQGQPQPLLNDVVATVAILGVDNIKHMDQPQIQAEQQQKQSEFSPAKGAADLVIDLLKSVLPTQLPDIRGQQQGQEQGAQQQQGGDGGRGR